jgi:nucleoside-diphosphate-sugar epimerase
MNILITGHKGFVGKYFLNKYDSHNIVGIDIKDGQDARDFFKKDTSSFDIVIHLAAIVGGRQTIENSPISVAVDLSIDAEFFGWCLRAKPKHIIYFSSSAAYPIEHQYRDSSILLREDMIDLDNIKSPDLTYGWAKLTGEYLAKFVSNEGINTTIFRPFSGYGSDQDLSYPFPSFIRRGLQKNNPFQIWGDGNQVRDFIHIKDIIDAVDECVKNQIYGTYNLGTGIPTSFNTLCKMICSQQRYSPNIEYMPSAPTGVMYRVCDPSLMLQFYKPKISLEEGISQALKESSYE